MLRTCAAWCAAIEEAPALWPTAILSILPALSWGRSWTLDLSDWYEARSAEELMRLAAKLDRFAWSVCIQCEDQQLGLAVSGVLLALPRTVRRLELQLDCAGPILAALHGMSQLSQLHITGNAAAVVFGGRGAAAVLPALASLRLDYRQPRHVTIPPLFLPYEEAQCLPAAAKQLAAAAGLTSLQLFTCWSEHTAALCRLSPLKDLSLQLYECDQATAETVLALLASRPSLTALALGIHAHCGPEQSYRDYGIEAWPARVHLPPLARLAAALTELRLVGAVSLPPDWRQLSRLQRLRVAHGAEAPDAWDTGATRDSLGRFEWGDGDLSSPTALTRLELGAHSVLPEAESVAAAPRLAQVVVGSGGHHWNHQRRAWGAALLQLKPEIWFADVADWELNTSAVLSSSSEESSSSEDDSSSSSDDDSSSDREGSSSSFDSSSDSSTSGSDDDSSDSDSSARRRRKRRRRGLG